MEKLRRNPPKAFGGHQVLKFRDYQTDRIVDMATGEEGKTGLPKSNVLYFELPDDAWCCARPSGTEPMVRVMIEGKDKKEIGEEAVKIARLIEQKLGGK